MSGINVGDRVLVSVPGMSPYTGLVERISTVLEFGGASSSTATVAPEGGRSERDRPPKEVDVSWCRVVPPLTSC